jgi:hypothetical protein
MDSEPVTTEKDDILLEERRRVCRLLAAHKAELGPLYEQLVKLVNSEAEADASAKQPPGKRAGPFDWTDE